MGEEAYVLKDWGVGIHLLRGNGACLPNTMVCPPPLGTVQGLLRRLSFPGDQENGLWTPCTPAFSLRSGGRS